ncbi:MAG: signal peptide peptidase SppA [Hyphomicrobium sp.]
MHPETETVLDRRRMRRGLSLWRSLAIAAVGLAIGAWALGNEALLDLATEHQIARVAIEGTILEDRQQLALLKRLKEAKGVKGVIVFVNSPGGTTTGGEALYEGLRSLAEDKPVVAQFGTVAASAGYIVGLGTDHIIARGNTITGSVGVIAQWPEFSDLLAKVGVKMNEVKSGELKAQPSAFAAPDPAALKVMQELIDDGFRWFISLVETRRGIKAQDLPGLEKGRVYSGRAAVDVKLVDEIGGEAEARRWLEDKRGIAKDLKIIDWKPDVPGGWGLGSSMASWPERLVEASWSKAMRAISGDRGGTNLGLDGLVSVWHPSEN